MAQIKPFAAVRPRSDIASSLCELPYDVLSSAEARQQAHGNPLSFFHVSKPEIDLPEGTDPYSPAVYAKARENFTRLIAAGNLRQDPNPCFYLYRQIMGRHSQTGFVAAASCEDYLSGEIKKHELTRPDKEDDRVRHIEALNSQTGPVFLTYPARPALDKLTSKITALEPDVDFTAKDGVRHSSWIIRDFSDISLIAKEFAAMPALYIADGHHRSAAAARIFQSRKGAGQCGFFLSVIFPDNQTQILPYNRVLKDLNGHSPEQLLTALNRVFDQVPGPATQPATKHEVSFFFQGKWARLRFKPQWTAAGKAVDLLDVSLLQSLVLQPLFGIDDPRTSKRISFVGGIRGAGELEKLVHSGEYVCAFSMFPTSITDLMSIADAGGIMPPKSTWFEPKLRDGMFSHMI
jgi:uncharacterized protein (DUF1015 family)